MVAYAVRHRGAKHFMNMIRVLSLPSWCIGLVAVGLAVSAPAQRPASGNAPLRLQVDEQTIDRNAPDRVSYAPVVEKSTASVVFVYSTKKVRAQELLPFDDDPMLRRFFGLPRGGMQAPEQTQRGLGSGVIISADGYILTNNHVVEGADDVKVSIGESTERHDATVVGTDALADIAVLKIEAKNLQPATLGRSSDLKVGDVVLAIGNPFGVGLSVSRGIVSAVSRGVGIEQIEDFIQTDAAINMGNSGGALIDSRGRVVGINTAILSRTGGFAGVGFAIPIDLARSVAQQIVSQGGVSRGFLGVAPQDLTATLAERFGAKNGALIAEVTPGSAAEKAGLEPGDVITRVNQVEVRDARNLLLTVSQLPPGTRAEIEYLRDGKQKTATATLERRPNESVAGEDGGAARGQSDKGVLNGVGVTDLSAQARQQLDIPDRVQGAVVTAVEPGSAAARQGLRVGDVIQSLDRRSVKNASEAIRLSEEIKGPQVLVRIWREGRSRFVVVNESDSSRKK